MSLEQQLDELSQMTCPRQVDVVDVVMSQVRQRPYLIAKPRHTLVRRIALSAAAVAAVAVIAVPALMHRSFNHEQVSSMIASVQDYDYYSHIESAADNPLEYLYDDPETATD